MKRILATVLCAAMVLGLAGCGAKSETTGNKELKKITLCLDWTPNTNHTGFYVASEKGYYEEAGLSVEIVQPPENGAAAMCASGQAQFAIEAQDTMAAALQLDDPLGITAVAGLVAHNTSGIISRQGDGIDRASGLVGKRYSTWESPIELAMLENLVNADGGDFNEVTLIPNDITDEPAALAANQTDAIWVFYGWGGINADVENVPCDFWYFKDLDSKFDYYTPVLIANNDFLKEDSETAKAFIEATKRGYEFAESNPSEAADMLIKGDTTGSLNSVKDLVYKSQEYLSKEYSDGKWGYIDPERWNSFYGWLYENGLCEKDLTGVGFTNDYLPE